MANKKSALKRIRQNTKRRLHNRFFRGMMRASVKDARKALEGNSVEEARTATLQAVSSLDKMAEKGIIHPNNAARRKSRLAKRLNALEKQAAG